MWFDNHIVPTHVSKITKNIKCCVWKILQDCISVSTCYDDLRYEKITLTHTQS